MNRYVSGDLGFFAGTKKTYVLKSTYIHGNSSKCYFNLPSDISNDEAKRRVCNFVAKNLRNKAFEWIIRRFLSLFSLTRNGPKGEFKSICNELHNRLLPSNFISTYTGVNGSTILENMIIELLESENLDQMLYNWDDIEVHPLILNPIFDL